MPDNQLHQHLVTIGSLLIEVESVTLGIGLTDNDGSISNIRVTHEGEENWESHQVIIIRSSSLGSGSLVNNTRSNSVVLLDLLGLYTQLNFTQILDNFLRDWKNPSYMKEAPNMKRVAPRSLVEANLFLKAQKEYPTGFLMNLKVFLKNLLLFPLSIPLAADLYFSKSHSYSLPMDLKVASSLSLAFGTLLYK